MTKVQFLEDLQALLAPYIAAGRNNPAIVRHINKVTAMSQEQFEVHYAAQQAQKAERHAAARRMAKAQF